MKMFVTPNFVQHNRLLRLVMLLIIAGLSIFLYTSYYANQTMERFPTSQRFHMPSMISVSSMLDSDTVVGNDNSFQSNEIDAKISSIVSSNKLVMPSGLGMDTSNDPQLRQQFLGNTINDNLSNSIAHFNVNNIVQQPNLVGESHSTTIECIVFFITMKHATVFPNRFHIFLSFIAL